MSVQFTGLSTVQAAEILAQDGIVAIPTETVYGLAGNAFSPQALARIFAAKGRPTFDPLIVHVADFDDLPRVVAHWPLGARQLAEAFWPGPLTLILPKNHHIPDLATSGLSTVGVRMPAHPMARDIIRLAKVPLAAPSANLFQRISPTTATHVMDQLGEVIDGVVDGGPCVVGVESTIVGFQGEQAVLYRPGAITPAMLESIVGPIQRHTPTSHPGEPDQAQPAPGLMERHYSPTTPLVLHSWPSVLRPKTGLLAFGSLPPQATQCVAVFQLSENGNPLEAAANLYAGLRQLDSLGLDCILATPLPEDGLGIAINDRLRRAATR